MKYSRFSGAGTAGQRRFPATAIRRGVQAALLALLVSGTLAESLPERTLAIGDRELSAEIAATPEARQRGLMYRQSLPPDAGMLFVYDEAAPRCFWMRNTLVPLSLAYADRSGVITQILDLTPLDETPRCSRQPARYALEMNQGWFSENGIGTGDRITNLP